MKHKSQIRITLGGEAAYPSGGYCRLGPLAPYLQSRLARDADTPARRSNLEEPTASRQRGVAVRPRHISRQPSNSCGPPTDRADAPPTGAPPLDDLPRAIRLPDAAKTVCPTNECTVESGLRSGACGHRRAITGQRKLSPSDRNPSSHIRKQGAAEDRNSDQVGSSIAVDRRQVTLVRPVNRRRHAEPARNAGPGFAGDLPAAIVTTGLPPSLRGRGRPGAGRDR